VPIEAGAIMPRGGRRQEMAQDDDSDDGLDPSQMSPNSKKEYDKKMIMTVSTLPAIIA
jgi:hypothetical protein